MLKTVFRKESLLRGRKRMLSTAGLCLAMFGASAAVAPASSTTKICSASDLHYFAPSLLVKDGVAFQTYLAEDRKLIAESKSITEALVAKINEEKPALFLVTGDLTKDGEKLSHQELAALLESIENNGVTKVYVIPGNHDINNPDAKSFDGDNATAVDYVTPAEFKTIYDKFGYGEAALVDTASITYLAKPSPTLWILGVDACMYKDNIATGHPITSGKINANTWKWILDRMAEAKAAGATVVGMMHHGLVEHYMGQNASYSEYLVTGWDTVSTKLADAGLKMMFTGHYHANDITKKAGTGTNFVFDIETGSTVTWPCPYRVMNLDANNYFEIATKHIQTITYDTKGKTFPVYAKEFLNNGLSAIVTYTLKQAPYSLSDAMASLLTPHVVAAYSAHYAGDEKMPADEKAFIAYLAANNNAMFAGMLTGLWTDLNPSDNNLFIDLNQGAPFQPTAYTSFVSKKTDKIGTFSGIDLFETGGSGLAYIPGSGNEFYTLGDRGPNIDAASSTFTVVNGTTITDTKIFPVPSYNPKVFKIALRGDSIAVLETLPLKRPNGAAVSGLPNPLSLGNAGEGVLTDNTQASKDAFLAKPTSFYDTLGIDCEGIAIGKNDDLWIADEYGVSVWQVSRSTGKLLNRYSPFKNMDAKYNNITIDTILAKRRPNRGFENIAIAPNGKVYALLQSAMLNPDNKSRIVRLLEIDPINKTSKTYAYLLPLVNGVKMKDWKLGDMTAINNNEFLVIAHGATDAIDRIFITKLDISNATPIAAEAYTLAGSKKTLEALVTKTDGTDVANLTKAVNGVADITPVADAMFLELYNESYPAYPSMKNIWNPAFSKPEGLAIVNDSTLAITFDNDFGLASSAAADGTVTANNQTWEVFMYNLKGENKIKNLSTPVERVSFNKKAISAFVGRSIAAPYKVLPAKATNQKVTIKSLDESIVSIKNDTILALKAGVVKLVVISNEYSYADTCTITVIAPQAKYVAGDFHQHSTYTDGSYTYGYMTEKNVRFGLDWWANSEHGGGFTTDGAVTGKDVDTIVYWDSYVPNPITGKVDGTPHAKMWRWQSLRDYEYKQVMATRLEYPNKVTLQSYEWNVPGHEHGSMGLIAGQFGEKSNCDAIAQFEYMFDNSDADVAGGAAQGWTKSTKSGHEKTLEALAWLKANYPTQSYVVPAHPERQKKYTIAHFRDMNTAAPSVCFGFESMAGHQKDAGRGGYSKSADGGGTYGGCGVYAAKVGGLWDAMLSEGRNFWLFASSDAHDVAGDFFPGEYQKTYTYTKDNSSAQAIVDGLRSGNSYVVEGDLIDSLIYQITPASNTALTASMGEQLQLTEKGINITIKMRDPQGANYNTYSSYTNPALHHVDVIMGSVGAKLDPTSANYNVPSVATTKVIARFDANGATTDANGVKSSAWTSTANGWKEMTLHLDNITDSVYFRLRATNLSLGVTNETDAAGNPLSDTLMGANNAEKAFADLWMYSNPIFVNQTKVFVDSVKLSAKTATIEVGKSADLTAVVSPAIASVQTITWKSMDETIATVVDGKVTAVKAGTVKIAVTTTDGAKTDTCVVTTTVSVASIAFANKTEKLEVGKSLELTPTVLPTGASNAAFTMKSMDETIAILVNGKVFALKAGKVKIAATTADGAKTDTCEITTTIPVASVSFASETITVEAGKSITIAAVALPVGATESTVTIRSLDATIVSVTGNTITAVKAGTVKLVATSADGLKTDTCVVKVVVPVSGITISSDFAELQKDETVTLTATIAPTGASNGAYTWKSSKPAVATVVDGVVTAKSNGQAVITVTSEDGSYTATCIVIVAEKTDLTDEQKQLFNIYPVPTSDELTIIIPQELSVSSLSLIGSNGAVVLSQSVEGLSTLNLNVSMFAKGNYYVEFFTANGVVTKQVIIK